MNIHLNDVPTHLPDGATVADAVAHLAPTLPYAVAVNLSFVPQSAHATQVLHEGDHVEIIAPVTGG